MGLRYLTAHHQSRFEGRSRWLAAENISLECRKTIAGKKVLKAPRKTIADRDVLQAMHELGFEHYATVLKLYLDGYFKSHAVAAVGKADRRPRCEGISECYTSGKQLNTTKRWHRIVINVL